MTKKTDPKPAQNKPSRAEKRAKNRLIYAVATAHRGIDALVERTAAYRETRPGLDSTRLAATAQKMAGMMVQMEHGMIERDLKQAAKARAA